MKIEEKNFFFFSSMEKREKNVFLSSHKTTNERNNLPHVENISDAINMLCTEPLPQQDENNNVKFTAAPRVFIRCSNFLLTQVVENNFFLIAKVFCPFFACYTKNLEIFLDTKMMKSISSMMKSSADKNNAHVNNLTCSIWKT